MSDEDMEEILESEYKKMSKNEIEDDRQTQKNMTLLLKEEPNKEKIDFLYNTNKTVS